MKRLSKTSSRCGSKRSGVGHVNDAKFASLYEKTDVDVDEDDERQPTKTLRMLSNSKLGGVNQELLQKMFVCSKCGKGFQSSKALCGHMACHSVKEKALRKKKQLLVIMDSQSDTESVAKSLRRRSRRGKCKKFAEDHVAVSMSKLHGYSYIYSSSEASGVEQEQEEVAISLMMLSRDSSNWVGLSSIGDSSENNSVVLEARSVSTKTMMNFGCKKIETLDHLECGYVRNGAKNVVADVKVGNSRKNQPDKRSKAEQSSSLWEFKSTEKPKMKLCSRMSAENGSYSATNQAFNENVAVEYKTFKAASSPESGRNSWETEGSVDHFPNNVHECPICFKAFRSVQTLGGHRRVHLAERCSDTPPALMGNVTQLHNFIDLNLPAPMEDEEAS